MMKHRNWRKRLTIVSILPAALVPSAFASGGIAGSDIGRGITNLIQDATVFIGAVGCTISVLAAIGFFAARSMADEQDGKMWNKRIKGAIICAVAIPLVAAFVNLLSSYF